MKRLMGVSGMVDSLRHSFPLQAEDFISQKRELPKYLLNCTMSAFVLSKLSQAHPFRGFSTVWDVFGTNKRYDFDFWFLITIRKLRSIEPILVIWSVLLMGVVYNIHYYTHQEFRLISFRL